MDYMHRFDHYVIMADEASQEVTPVQQKGHATWMITNLFLPTISR